MLLEEVNKVLLKLFKNIIQTQDFVLYLITYPKLFQHYNLDALDLNLNKFHLTKLKLEYSKFVKLKSLTLVNQE